MNTTIVQNKIREFTDILAWQEAHRLVVDVYRLTDNFPKQAMYGLSSQMQRAAVSITSNIAEGFGRQGYRDKIRFYYIAHGSLTELKNQMIIAKDIGYATMEKLEPLISEMTQAHRLLQGLISKSKEFLNLES